jgi:hypothetical protein
MADPAASQMVRVMWRDAHACQSTWLHISELDPEPYEVCSVGYLLVGVKPGHLVVAQSVAPGGHVDGATAIPVGMVMSIDYLSAHRGLPLEVVA